MYVQLETDRLLIRPLTRNDSKFMLKLLNTEGWLQFIGDRNVKNEADANNYIEQIAGTAKYFYNVFALKETGQPIGIVTFLERDNQEHPDIGFALLQEFEGKGYAFEASSRYLDELKNTGQYENIIGITYTDNFKSIKLLTKLGLKHELDYEEAEKSFSRYSIN